MDNYTPKIIKLIAYRIDSQRCTLGLSIRELAKKAGISKTTLQSIIQGTKIPNILTLQNLTNALSISLSDLLNDNKEVLKLRGKETIVIKLYREVSPMSQDTVIKMLKCMK